MKVSVLKNLFVEKKYIYPVVLSLFSIIINQYYGYIGILPIDSFLIFNSGYDVLNGFYPFKDYWTIKEPFIDFLQAFFFKVFGVSWFSYVFHASIFNLLISLSTYFILRYFKLSVDYSFLYAFCVSVLTYPTAGTPFSDHHTLILCLLSLYLFFVTLKTNNRFLWFLIPFFLGFSFLSKQAPTAYLILVISFISLIYFFYKKNFSGLVYSILGLLAFIIFFITILFILNIKIIDFVNQYILFPQSLGATRLDWVFPLEFKRIVLRFKIHYISIFFLIFIIVKYSINKNRKIKIEEVLIALSLILTCLLLIFHQLMTINAIFIYCVIPIFFAFSQIYCENFYNKKSLKIFFMSALLISSTYYFIKYVHSRTFMDLNSVDISKAVDAKKIDNRLSGIKWISMFYPEQPNKEIENINFAIKVLKNESKKKMLITDYQFISVFLNEYDYSVTRFWYDFHGYPSKGNRFFDYWKDFVIKKIKENNITKIYVLKPLHGDKKPLENIFGHCLDKKILSTTLYWIDISRCKI